MLGSLKFKPGLVFAFVFGCFFALYITVNPCYAAARVTTTLLEQIPAKTWAADSTVEFAAAYYGVSLELIDYIKPPFVYTAHSSPVVTPGPIATSYFLGSVEQKMYPVITGKVIGNMKAMKILLKHSKTPSPWWMNSYKGYEWYAKRSAAIYAKIINLKK